MNKYTKLISNLENLENVKEVSHTIYKNYKNIVTNDFLEIKTNIENKKGQCLTGSKFYTVLFNYSNSNKFILVNNTRVDTFKEAIQILEDLETGITYSIKFNQTNKFNYDTLEAGIYPKQKQCTGSPRMQQESDFYESLAQYVSQSTLTHPEKLEVYFRELNDSQLKYLKRFIKITKNL